jgi:MFS family permease
VSSLSAPYRALTIGMITLVTLIAFEAVAVTTAMPSVATALDGLPLYALAFGGTLAASVVGVVVAGAWGDARGPVGPTWVGTGLFAAGLLIAGVAPDMWVLVGGRVVQGFGSGLVVVALYVVVGRAYPADLHPRVFAAFAGAWVLPSIAGPSVAGLIVEHLHWRWVFLGVLLLAVPSLLLVQPGLRGLPPAGRAAMDLSAAKWAVTAAVSVGLLHVGGQRGGLDGVLLIGAGLAGLVVSTPKLLPTGTFAARRGLPSVVLLRGFAGAAFIQTDVFIPLMLTRERGFSPSAAGLTLTIGGLAWCLGSWYQSRWGQRVTPRARLTAGLSLIAVGVASAAAVVAPTVPVAVVVAGWFLGGLGMGVSYPTMSALTLRLAPAGREGQSSSSLQLSDSLHSTTVLAISGTLFAALVATSPPTAFLTAYGLAFAIAAAGIWVAQRTATQTPTPAASLSGSR